MNGEDVMKPLPCVCARRVSVSCVSQSMYGRVCVCVCVCVSVSVCVAAIERA
jgi:hypothetical protein